MYSSSDPAIANGTTGAPVRRAMSAAPTRNGRESARRARDAALGEEDEHAAGIDHGAGRGEVLVDADPASPDREHAAEVPQQPLLPALVECRGGAAEEPRHAAPAAARGGRGTDPSSRDGSRRRAGSRRPSAAGRAPVPTRSIRNRSRPKKTTNRAIGARARTTSDARTSGVRPSQQALRGRRGASARSASGATRASCGRERRGRSAGAAVAGPAAARARSAGGRRGDRVVDGRDVEGLVVGLVVGLFVAAPRSRLAARSRHPGRAVRGDGGRGSPARPRRTRPTRSARREPRRRSSCSVRSNSSTNRTLPYQMKNTATRSPGRSRCPYRRVSNRIVTNPRKPESDSYRNSGWKCSPSVAAGSEPGGHAYSTTRWAQSIAMPHGRFVGGP